VTDSVAEAFPPLGYGPLSIRPYLAEAIPPDCKEIEEHPFFSSEKVIQPLVGWLSHSLREHLILFQIPDHERRLAPKAPFFWHTENYRALFGNFASLEAGAEHNRSRRVQNIRERH